VQVAVPARAPGLARSEAHWPPYHTATATFGSCFASALQPEFRTSARFVRIVPATAQREIPCLALVTDKRESLRTGIGVQPDMGYNRYIRFINYLLYYRSIELC
jgi:hypothetical protein